MEVKKNTAATVLVAALMAMLIAGALTVVLRYNSALDAQFHAERGRTLMTITDKCSECMDVTINNAWQDARTCETLLGYDYAAHASHYRSTDMLTAVAQEMQNKIYPDVVPGQGNMVMLIDSNFRVYTGNGNRARWQDPEALEDSAANGRSIVIDTLPGRGSDETGIFLTCRLETALPVGKRSITHVAIALPAEDLRSAFHVGEYGDKSFAYVVDTDGGRLCRYRQSGSFIDVYNVFSAFEAADYVAGDSVEDIRASIKANEKNKNHYIAFNYEGTSYYAAASSLVSGEWFLVMFVPLEALAKNATMFAQTTYSFFMMLMLIIAAAVGLIVFYVTRLSSQQKLVRQQRSANEQLAEAAERAEAASAAKTSFLSNMSHDIRTPINGIMGMTAIARKEKDIPPKVRECLDKIDGSSHHLLSLINDVLDMSRIEAGKTVIAHEPIDICGVASNCESIIRGQIDGRDIRFITEFGEIPHPRLLGDELRIRQILINILGNAVKFTPDGGSIWFGMTEAAANESVSVIRFVIRDTGCGMKAEFLEHIWDAFSQAEAGARSRYKGTGLGMAITKQFVDLMHGDISVQSTEGQGSCFTVELPFDIDTAAREAETAEAEAVSVEGVRVMLVEDNEINMEVATELLSDEGIVVTPAENGQAAVELFEAAPEGSFDVILMDIMMPVMDGLEATRHIRALDRPDAKSVPIVAMSANAFDEDVRRSREAGMDAHLSKPINIDLTLKTIAAFARRRSE